MNHEQQALTQYVQQLTQVLQAQGVKHAVISPGSRSTPLAYAFAESLEITVHTDERSAAFYALGLVKAAEEPVVLLCTSGTAASNYHPAVTEAYYARLPLIVITADRPHELREVGAPQAIDQIRMFGEHVKESVDFPVPEYRPEIMQYMEQRAARLLSSAKTAPRGPVHLNIPFREPLLIDFQRTPEMNRFRQAISGSASFTALMKEFAENAAMNAEKGLIIVGEQPPSCNKQLFWQFAKKLQWPVICDPLSNFRSEVPADCFDLCIDQYDAILKSVQFCDTAAPDTVIRFGPQPISKPLSQFLKKSCPAVYITVDESPNFRDPLALTTDHLQTSEEALWQGIDVQLERTAYASHWIQANEQSAAVFSENRQFTGDEGHAVRQFIASLPDQSDVICSSSMPIRDIDTHFHKTGKDIALFCNRGTNGIDGVVSTALGIQKERGRTTYLLIGDLSFLHDVNGLIVSAMQQTDLTIVIMNNNGGGIFSYLPQASVASHYETLFGTPTNITFEQIAKMYNAQYDAAHSIAEFEAALSVGKTADLRIIEMFTNRVANVAAHRAVWQEVIKRVEQIEI